MNVFAIVGSIREKSFNMHLAKWIQERYRDTIHLEIADLKSIPLFNQDEELDPPQAVKTFKEKVKQADAIMIVTPEYNWSMPGVLKNALDWASRVDKVFIGKKIMLLGASMSNAGTLRSQLHLRQVFTSPGIQAVLLPPATNEVAITLAHQKIDEETGEITDQDTIDFLDRRIESFIEFVRGS